MAEHENGAWGLDCATLMAGLAAGEAVVQRRPRACMSIDEQLDADVRMYGVNFERIAADGTRERIDPSQVRFDPKTRTYILPGKIDEIAFTVHVEP